MKKNSLKHFERVKSPKLIERIFSKEAQSIFEDSITLRYLLIEKSDFPLKAGFSVSKKLYKRAVDRNKFKRWLRESYREKKFEMIQPLQEKHQALVLFFILIKKIEEPNFKIIDEKIAILCEKLYKKLEKIESKNL